MTTSKQATTPAIPLGTETVFSVTCKDVVMGRGSGTQNHCGNVTYRKLVSLNKELYATSTKFHKLKVSKAVVAAVREHGGRFVQERGGLYSDIGDRRAWHKTSQALREGQARVRARLAEEDPTGRRRVAVYNRVVREQSFFEYACRMIESLHRPLSGESGISACGEQCPLAMRRQNHSAVQVFAPLPKSYDEHQDQPHNVRIDSGVSYQGSNHFVDPLPLNTPLAGDDVGSYKPVPYACTSRCADLLGLPSQSSGSSKKNYANLPLDLFEPIPYEDGPLGPELASNEIPGGGSPGIGSVFAVQTFCNEDLDIAPEEGKDFMDQLNRQLNQEVGDCQNSYSSIQFDTMLFDEDSMVFANPKEDGRRGGSIPEKDKNSVTGLAEAPPGIQAWAEI